MLGAIIGDIAGSRFEWNNIKTKEFDLLTYRCEPTDDSIMTLAIAKALLESKDDHRALTDKTIKWMQALAGYGCWKERGQESTSECCIGQHTNSV